MDGSGDDEEDGQSISDDEQKCCESESDSKSDTASPAKGEKDASEESAEAEGLTSEGGGGTEDLASDGSSGTEELASDGSGETEELASDGSSGTEDLASEGCGGAEDLASEGSGGTEDLASEGSSGTEGLASELALCRSRASANQEKLWEDIASTIAMDLETFSRQYGTHAGNLIQSLRTIKRETVDYSAFLRKFATHAEVMRVSQEEFDLNYYTYGLKINGDTPLMQSIEVASCSITRHEWDTATRHNNAERYFFYLWCIGTAGNNLAIIDVKDMAEQIPSDMNQGKWENATVPYSAFIGRFSSMACNFPE